MKSFLFIAPIVAYENRLLLRDRHLVIHTYRHLPFRLLGYNSGNV